MPEDASIFSAGSMVEELMGLHPSDWTLVHHVTDTMLRLAQMGNVILVGRGANIITAHRKNAFHVRLVAPRDLRIERAAELNNLGAKEAAAFVRKSDRARRRYVKLHFRVAIDEPLLYDATLNTGRFSFETAARLIAEALALQGTP
jgi:cytidylate kinase